MPYTETDIVRIFRRKANELGRGLTASEWEDMDDTTGKSVPYRFFDSFPDFREAAGYSRKNPKHESKEELIEAIKNMGEPRHQSRFREATEYTPHAIHREFGSWNAAVEAAGFEPNVKFWDEEDCIEALEKFHEKHGRLPMQDELHDSEYSDELPSSSPVERYFGNMTGWFRAGGFEPRRDTEITEENCIRAVKEAAEEVDGPLTSKKYRELGKKPSIPSINRCIGFNEIKRRLGLEIARRVSWSEEECTEEIQRVADELGRAPFAREAFKMDMSPSAISIIRTFESWNAAIEAAGYEPRNDGDGADWNYGPEWIGIRERIRDRDNHTCQKIGCNRTNEENIEEFGCELPVHHIVPSRKFDTEEEAHKDENLITLCSECHPELEAIDRAGYDVSMQLEKIKRDQNPVES